MKSDSDRMKELVATFGQIRAMYPFWYEFAANFGVEFSEVVANAATDGLNIVINPNAWDKWPQDLRRFVVVHEIAHVALRHFGRAKWVDEKIATIVNVAMDIEIHRMLIAAGINPPDWAWGVKPEDSRFDNMPWEQILKILRAENPQQNQKKNPGQSGQDKKSDPNGQSDKSDSSNGSGKSDSKGKGKESDASGGSDQSGQSQGAGKSDPSAGSDKSDQSQGSGKSDASDASDQSGPSGGSGQNDPNGQPDKNGQSGGAGGSGKSGQPEKTDQNQAGQNPGGSGVVDGLTDQQCRDKMPGWFDPKKVQEDAEKAKRGESVASDHSLQKRVDDMMKGAVERTRSHSPGSVPGWAKNWYDENCAPKEIWDFSGAFDAAVNSKVGEVRYTRKRFDPRYISRGIYNPGELKDSLGGVVFSIDTSGSVSATSLQEVVSQVMSILENYRFDSYRVITWAIGVADSDDMYSSGEVEEYVKNAPTDRGGTNPCTFFEYFNKNVFTAGLIVVFTDSDTVHFVSKLKEYEPNVPVLWVFVDGVSEDITMPFGTVIPKVKK